MAELPEDSTELFPVREDDAPLTLPIPNLTEDQKDALGQTVMVQMDTNLGNRSGYDRMLDVSEAMFELRTQPRNVPWPNAANFIPPKVPEKIFEVTSRVVGTVFQPRLFTVTGNDPLSSQYSHTIEQFYNNESQTNEWLDPLEECVALAARDGLAWSEILWDLTVEEQIRVSRDPQTGKREQKLINLVRYDAPRVSSVMAKDIVLFPNYAPTPDAADSINRKIYMSEEDLWKAVNGGRGIFWPDRVERALTYVSTGMGELSYDRQGYSTYTVGGLINVSDVNAAAPSGIRMTRGPIEVWQCLTKQYYFDENFNMVDDPSKGKPMRCFVWVHDRSRIAIGLAPYEYWGGVPYFPLSLWPRPGRIYGMGVPFLTRGLVEEKTGIHWARADYNDMAAQPMRWRTRNARFRDEDRRWGPDAEVEVTAGQGLTTQDFGFVGMPPWPQGNDNEEDRIDAMIESIVASPQAPAQVQPGGGQSQQRSARAAQTDAQIRGMASNMINRRVRKWVLKNFTFLHSLYQQYAPNQVQTVEQIQGANKKVLIPKEIFGLDYTLGVAGMGGAIDKEARRGQMLELAQFLMQTPLVNGNLQRIWTVARLVVETFDVPEVTSLIGTMDDAMQQAKSQAEAQQMNEKKQMLMQLLSHGNFDKSGKPNAQMQGGGQMQPFHKGGAA